MQRATAVAALLMSVALPAQRLARPELTLELQAKDEVNGVPQRIRLTLRNMTEHDLRLPEPGIACRSTFGSFFVRVTPASRAVPSRDNACQQQDGYGNPKNWITLGPGGYLDRWYSARQFHLESSGPGIAALEGEYLPPSLRPVLAQSLESEGIVFPRTAVRSKRVAVFHQAPR